MRRFTHKVGTAAAVAVLAAFLQGCYTYMPTMSREADGVLQPYERSGEGMRVLPGMPPNRTSSITGRIRHNSNRNIT